MVLTSLTSPRLRRVILHEKAHSLLSKSIRQIRSHPQTPLTGKLRTLPTIPHPILPRKKELAVTFAAVVFGLTRDVSAGKGHSVVLRAG
jgi:hypothetical protein